MATSGPVCEPLRKLRRAFSWVPVPTRLSPARQRVRLAATASFVAVTTTLSPRVNVDPSALVCVVTRRNSKALSSLAAELFKGKRKVGLAVVAPLIGTIGSR